MKTNQLKALKDEVIVLIGLCNLDSDDTMDLIDDIEKLFKKYENK